VPPALGERPRPQISAVERDQCPCWRRATQTTTRVSALWCLGIGSLVQTEVSVESRGFTFAAHTICANQWVR
jgi:hypothetical protein